MTTSANYDYGPVDLNYESVKQVVGESDQAMVYGWTHTKYTEVGRELEKPESPIKKVFSCSIGNARKDEVPADKLTTLEGRKMEQVKMQEGTKEPASLLKKKNKDADELNTSRMCKSGIVNLVLENYKRKQEGAELIPLLFISDAEGNPWQQDSITYTSKETDLNKLVTHSELRRIYKITNTLGDKELQQVAKETIRFIKLVHSENNKTEFKEVAPFWDAPDWNDKWAERKLKSEPKVEDENMRWQAQLTHARDYYEGTSKIPDPYVEKEALEKMAMNFSDLLDECNEDKATPIDEFKKFLINKDKNEFESITQDPYFKVLYDMAKLCSGYTEKTH